MNLALTLARYEKYWLNKSCRTSPDNQFRMVKQVLMNATRGDIWFDVMLVYDNNEGEIVPKGEKTRPSREDVEVEGERVSYGKALHYTRKMPRRKAQRLFLKNLERCLGNKTRAADMTGIHRDTLYHWARNDPRFAEELAAREYVIVEIKKDMAEGTLTDLVELGDGTSTRYLLDHQAKDRGYGEERKSEQSPVLPGLNVNILQMHMPPEPKSLADWQEQVKEAYAQLEDQRKQKQLAQGEVIDVDSVNTTGEEAS